MVSNRCLPTLAIVAFTLVGSSCSDSTSNGGKGGSGSGTGGGSGGASATSTGGVPGSGGVTSSGAGGNGQGGSTKSGVGGSANGGGKSGSGSGAAATGGNGSGGTGSGGAGSGGSTGTGGSGAGGSTTGVGGTNPGTGGAGGAATGGSKGAGGTSGTGGSNLANGGTVSGGTTGGSGTGGTTSTGTAVGSNGCGKTSTLTFGTVPGESGAKVGTGKGGYVTIQSGGGSRGFALRLPDNYDNTKPSWLIFGFHWNGGSAAEVDSGGGNGYWWSYYGMQRKSNNNAIFVAPDGLGAGWSNSGGNDLKFVDDMVKLIEDNYCVDTKNIITMGFSYGGGMSYEIACARANVFRAAVIYEGAQLSGCDGGNDPIALWQTEGLTDPTCKLYPHAMPIRDRFVKNNGCTPLDASLDCSESQFAAGKCPATAAEPPSPSPYLNPGGHICTDYKGCSSGHPLRWCVHQSAHGPGPIDGNSDLYNSCATPPKTCSTSCPCTWTPDDVWPWLNGQTITGQTPNATTSK